VPNQIWHIIIFVKKSISSSVDDKLIFITECYKKHNILYTYLYIYAITILYYSWATNTASSHTHSPSYIMGVRSSIIYILYYNILFYFFNVDSWNRYGIVHFILGVGRSPVKYLVSYIVYRGIINIAAYYIMRNRAKLHIIFRGIIPVPTYTKTDRGVEGIIFFPGPNLLRHFYGLKNTFLIHRSPLDCVCTITHIYTAAHSLTRYMLIRSQFLWSTIIKGTLLLQVGTRCYNIHGPSYKCAYDVFSLVPLWFIYYNTLLYCMCTVYTSRYRYI